MSSPAAAHDGGAIHDDRRAWQILIVLCLAVFMLLLDTTVVNVAQVKIKDSLGASLTQIQWILDSYILAYAVLLLSFGRLGDIYGRKKFFMIGMAFAYFFVFPVMFGFFAGYAPAGVQMMTDIDKYFSFVLGMFLAFGLTFEVPVIVIVLVRMRVVSLEKLRSIRSYVIVGAFVVGAIFTPPDVLSQLMLAVPLWLLYELGLILARFVSVPAPAADGEEAAAK